MIRFLHRIIWLSVQAQGPVHRLQEAAGTSAVDPPGEVLDAHSVLGVCEGAAHLHLELRVKEQHKVDPAVVSVHVHEEGVLDHQPAPRPAEAQLVVADAVQALDPVATRPLENGSFPERRGHMSREGERTSLFHTFPPNVLGSGSLQSLGSEVRDKGQSSNRKKLQLKHREGK